MLHSACNSCKQIGASLCWSRSLCSSKFLAPTWRAFFDPSCDASVVLYFDLFMLADGLLQPFLSSSFDYTLAD